MGWMGPVVNGQAHEGWVVPLFADSAGQRTLLAIDLNGEPLAPLRALKRSLSSWALGGNTPGRIRAPRPIRFGCRRDHHPRWAFIDHGLQAAGSRCCPTPDQDSARRSRTTFAAK